MGRSKTRRETADFSLYPDLVVMYLGMRVRALRGIKTLFGLGPKIGQAGAAWPDGLLHYENNIVFSFVPLHIGMRWYWRDMASLEAWSKSEPHALWWKNFLVDAGGLGFWHETYHMRGGMEAIYDNLDASPGFGQFMPVVPARGSMASRHKNFRSPDLAALPSENWPGPSSV